MIFKLGIRKLGAGPCQALAMIFTSRKFVIGKFGSGDNFCNLERFSSQAAGNICEIDGKIVGGWEMV